MTNTNLLLFILCCGVLSVAMVTGSYILAIQKPDVEKTSVFESGFDPTSTARQQFSVPFFLVGILFILFDLEIIYLLPFAVNFFQFLTIAPLFFFSTFLIFFLILLLGVLVEIMSNALDFA